MKNEKRKNLKIFILSLIFIILLFANFSFVLGQANNETQEKGVLYNIREFLSFAWLIKLFKVEQPVVQAPATALEDCDVLVAAGTIASYGCDYDTCCGPKSGFTQCSSSTAGAGPFFPDNDIYSEQCWGFNPITKLSDIYCSHKTDTCSNLCRQLGFPSGYARCVECGDGIIDEPIEACDPGKRCDNFYPCDATHPCATGQCRVRNLGMCNNPEETFCNEETPANCPAPYTCTINCYSNCKAAVGPTSCTPGTECRNSTGVCDEVEICDANGTCPADSFKPNTEVCRASTGSCDSEEKCIGSSADCPADTKQPEGTVCDDNNACTANDVCTNGVCAGAGENCDDNDVCTIDTCISSAASINPFYGFIIKMPFLKTIFKNILPSSEQCKHTPIEGCCKRNSDCDDKKSCTNDVCNPETHVCEDTPDNDKCENDGWTCTKEQCNPDSEDADENTGCVSIKDNSVCANPLMPCNEHICDPENQDYPVEPVRGCIHPVKYPCCGNGKVETGEGCDDGNLNDGDGCSSSCQSETSGGDGPSCKPLGCNELRKKYKIQCGDKLDNGCGKKIDCKCPSGKVCKDFKCVFDRHLECKDNTCTEVPGAGENTCKSKGQKCGCTDDIDCRKFDWKNPSDTKPFCGYCKKESSGDEFGECDVYSNGESCLLGICCPGGFCAPQCSPDEEPEKPKKKYKDCVEEEKDGKKTGYLLCKNVPMVSGNEKDKCTDDDNCNKKKHKECQGEKGKEKCIEVDGVTSNDCEEDSECVSHLECKDNKCTEVPGAGENKCKTKGQICGCTNDNECRKFDWKNPSDTKPFCGYCKKESSGDEFGECDVYSNGESCLLGICCPGGFCAPKCSPGENLCEKAKAEGKTCGSCYVCVNDGGIIGSPSSVSELSSSSFPSNIFGLFLFKGNAPIVNPPVKLEPMQCVKGGENVKKITITNNDNKKHIYKLTSLDNIILISQTSFTLDAKASGEIKLKLNGDCPSVKKEVTITSVESIAGSDDYQPVTINFYTGSSCPPCNEMKLANPGIYNFNNYKLKGYKGVAQVKDILDSPTLPGLVEVYPTIIIEYKGRRIGNPIKGKKSYNELKVLIDSALMQTEKQDANTNQWSSITELKLEILPPKEDSDKDSGQGEETPSAPLGYEWKNLRCKGNQVIADKWKQCIKDNKGNIIACPAAPEAVGVLVVDCGAKEKICKNGKCFDKPAEQPASGEEPAADNNWNPAKSEDNKPGETSPGEANRKCDESFLNELRESEFWEKVKKDPKYAGKNLRVCGKWIRKIKSSSPGEQSSDNKDKAISCSTLSPEEKKALEDIKKKKDLEEAKNLIVKSIANPQIRSEILTMDNWTPGQHKALVDAAKKPGPVSGTSCAPMVPVPDKCKCETDKKEEEKTEIVDCGACPQCQKCVNGFCEVDDNYKYPGSSGSGSSSSSGGTSNNNWQPSNGGTQGTDAGTTGDNSNQNQPATCIESQDVDSKINNANVKITIKDPKWQDSVSGTIIGYAKDDKGEEYAIILTVGHGFRDSQGKGPISVDLSATGNTEAITGNLIAYDLERDLGLIKIKKKDIGNIPISVIPIAPPGFSINKGDSVKTAGCSQGQACTIQCGSINAVNKYVGYQNFQVSGIPIQGRSGGGLFTGDGKYLIGVTQAADHIDNSGLFGGLGSIQDYLGKLGLSWVYKLILSFINKINL